MVSLTHLVTLGFLLAGAAVRADEAGQVIIHNRTGVELKVRRPSSGPATAVLIRSGQGEQQLCCAFPGRSPEAAGPLEYGFRDGDTATFQFAEMDQDLSTELVFWHEDGERGVVFKGTVTYAISHEAGPDGHGRVEGRLLLPKGPTPRTWVLPQNRNIEVLSATELALR